MAAVAAGKVQLVSVMGQRCSSFTADLFSGCVYMWEISLLLFVTRPLKRKNRKNRGKNKKVLMFGWILCFLTVQYCGYDWIKTSVGCSAAPDVTVCG